MLIVIPENNVILFTVDQKIWTGQSKYHILQITDHYLWNYLNVCSTAFRLYFKSFSNMLGLV